MVSAASAAMTAEQFCEFVQRPENQDRCFELERGGIVELPLTGVRYGVVAANIGRILGDYAVSRRCGVVCSNRLGLITLRNPDTVRGVDIAFLDQDSAELQTDVFSEAPPKLAVDVCAPENTASRTNRRTTELLRMGTPMVWVIDPEYRIATVFAGSSMAVLEREEEISGGDVLPDFRVQVRHIFALPGEVS